MYSLYGPEGSSTWISKVRLWSSEPMDAARSTAPSGLSPVPAPKFANALENESVNLLLPGFLLLSIINKKGLHRRKPLVPAVEAISQATDGSSIPRRQPGMRREPHRGKQPMLPGQMLSDARWSSQGNLHRHHLLMHHGARVACRRPSVRHLPQHLF